MYWFPVAVLCVCMCERETDERDGGADIYTCMGISVSGEEAIYAIWTCPLPFIPWLYYLSSVSSDVLLPHSYSHLKNTGLIQTSNLY